MIGFCPLASGSKGNAIYFGTKKTRILIDAGLSASNLLARLQAIGVAPDTIEAILVTHEHSDHISALLPIVEKFHIPIFTNAETAKGIYQATGVKSRFKIFTTGESFAFGDLEIHPFTIPHDTLDPVAFTLKTETLKIGFCTDLGYATTLVKKQLEHCDYLYLEANHQVSMVHSSRRSESLKKRILGRQGHLSNAQCAELLSHVHHAGLKHVHLAHLSEECNTEEMALKTVSEFLAAQHKSVELSIAHQQKPSHPILFEV